MKVPEIKAFKHIQYMPKVARLLSPQIQRRQRQIQPYLNSEKQLTTAKSTKFFTNNNFYQIPELERKININEMIPGAVQGRNNEYLNKTLIKLDEYKQNTANLYKNCHKCEILPLYTKYKQEQEKLKNIQQINTLKDKYEQKQYLKIPTKDVIINKDMIKETQITKPKKKDFINEIKQTKLIKKKSNLDDFVDKDMVKALKQILVQHKIQNLNDEQIIQMLLILDQIRKMKINFEEKKKMLALRVKQWKHRTYDAETQINFSFHSNIKEKDQFTLKIENLFKKVQDYQSQINNKLNNNQSKQISIYELVHLRGIRTNINLDQNVKITHQYVDKIDQLIKKVQTSQNYDRSDSQFSFFK